MDRAKRGEEQGEAELLSERSTWTKDWQDGDICPTQSQTLTKDKLPSEDTESYRFLPLLKVTAAPLIGSFSLNSSFCHSFTSFSVSPLYSLFCIFNRMHHLFACCVLLYCGFFSCNFLLFDASENRLICFKGRFAIQGSSEQSFRLMCRNRWSDLASQRPKTAAGRDEVKSIIICQGCLHLKLDFTYKSNTGGRHPQRKTRPLKHF